MIPADRAQITFLSHTSTEAVLFRLSGSLTISTLEKVEQDFDLHLPKCPGKKVIMDLSQAPFVSSTGWSFFLYTHARLRAMEGELLLAGMKPEILMIFEMLDFGNFMRHFPTVAEALTYSRSLSAAGKSGEPVPAVPEMARPPKKGWRALIPSPARRRLGGEN